MRLEGKDIRFGYHRLAVVLDTVSLHVDHGERVGLVGPSGCGKSTLAQILAGYIKPWSGEVLLDNRLPMRHQYNPVQMIYQHPEKALNPKMTLQKSLSESWAPNERSLAGLGIEPQWLNRYPSELSGGELQRICIARALGPATQIIIADEITTMLDVITQAQIWQLLLDQVKQRELGLLVISHNLKLVNQICTRVIMFEDL